MGLGFLNPGCNNCACDWTRSWYALSCDWEGPPDVVNYLQGTVFDFGVLAPELLDSPPVGFLGGAAASEGGAFYAESTLDLNIDLVHVIEEGESPPEYFANYIRTKVRYYGFELSLGVAHTVDKPNWLYIAIYLNYRFSVLEHYIQGWTGLGFGGTPELVDETYTTGDDFDQGADRTGLVPGLRGVKTTSVIGSGEFPSRIHCCRALKPDPTWPGEWLARPYFSAWNSFVQAIPRYYPPGSPLGVGIGYPPMVHPTNVFSQGGRVIQLSHNSVFAVACNRRPLFSLIGSDTVAATIEETDSTLTASGTVTVRDPDTADTVTVEVLSVQAAGDTAGLVSTNEELMAMLTVTPAAPDTLAANPTDVSNLEWIFDSGTENFDYLEATEDLNLFYILRAKDADEQYDLTTITITIQGSNECPDPTDYEELAAEFDWNPILMPGQPYNWSQSGGISHVIDFDNVSDISVSGVPTNASVLIGTDEAFPDSVVIQWNGTNTPGTYDVSITGEVASGDHEGCPIEFVYEFEVTDD